MGGSRRGVDPIPEQFSTIREASAFWDCHELTDYPDEVEDVEFEVDLQHRQYLVGVAPDLYCKLAQESHRQGLQTETLVNLWLTERLGHPVS
jgi:hypothetical protein